jgi:hypothetical protein
VATKELLPLRRELRLWWSSLRFCAPCYVIICCFCLYNVYPSLSFVFLHSILVHNAVNIRPNNMLEAFWRCWGTGEISCFRGGDYESDCLWGVAPCSLVEVYWSLRGACCLHHQCQWDKEPFLALLSDKCLNLEIHNILRSRIKYFKV